MKFITYKYQEPINLATVESMELYSDSLNFKCSGGFLTWVFDEKGEAEKVYQEILKQFSQEIKIED